MATADEATGDPTPLAFALEYAGSGYRVLPVWPVVDGSCACGTPARGDGSPGCKPGKHPLGSLAPRGCHSATTDEAVIEGWFKAWPGANVGIATGPESGLFVLGPDGEQGVADLAALAAPHGGLPPTLTARTPSGGRHHYFRWPADGGKPFTTAANHRGTKIDFRGKGGYVVAPPSRTDRGRYTWEVVCQPVEAPAWLVEWVRGRDPKPAAAPPAPPPPAATSAASNGSAFTVTSTGPTAVERCREYVRKIDGGVMGSNGSKPCMWVARVCRWGFKLTEDESRPIMREYSERCTPSWSPGEIDHKLKQAGERGKFEGDYGWLLNEALPSGPRSGQKETAPPPPPGSRLVTRRASEVTPQAVKWLWRGYIPAGMLSEINGDQGGGKGTISADLIACATTGRPFPFAKEGRDPVNVLWLSAEDTPEYVLSPRLIVAGADLDRVFFLSHILGHDGRPRMLVLPDDLEEVRGFVRSNDIRLVVIDPLNAYLSGRVDSHNDASSRAQLLSPMQKLAEETGAAIVSVRHLNKMTGGNAAYRAGGSIAYTGAARVSLMANPLPDDPDRRALAVVKTNVGASPPSLEYAIDETALEAIRDTVSRVRWVGPIDITAKDLGDAPTQKRPGKVEDAETFIREELGGGPVASEELFKRAKEQGFSERTMFNAKKKMPDVEAKRVGFDSHWVWRLVGQDCTTP